MVRLSSKHPYIAVAGVMGSGKTTACRLLAKTLKFCLIEERPEKNIFLKRFYREPKRWAFHAQLFYLKERSVQLRKIARLLRKTGVIHDSPIYQDRFTYARTQLLLGNMTEGEYALYQKLFDEFQCNFLEPHLIVNLEASLSIIEDRIQKRGRKYEKEVDTAYLKTLIKLQKEWVSNHKHLSILTVNTDHLNLAEDENHQKEFVQMVRNSISRH